MEPAALAPPDPLAMSPEVRNRIGTDATEKYASPEGSLMRRQWFPYYEEERGDYRFRMLPPLYFEHTRGLPSRSTGCYAIPPVPDRESVIPPLLFYQRRSQNVDADVLFPIAWRVRERQNSVYVLGPIVHREAPFEWDNWLAPLLFVGQRKNGGYFHSIFLTSSHWDEKGAFTLIGPYFRDRTGSDVDLGIAPLFFHGDNGDMSGNRRTYTLIPPLLFYTRTREIDESSMTVAGPVILQSNLKRDIFDVAPLFFHIRGKPESGGIREEHTTLFPFFHYGYKPNESLFVVPGYLRRTTKTADTMITPFYSHSTGRGGATSLNAIGPVVPLLFTYSDKDLGVNAFGLAPLFYRSTSPVGDDFLTPLVGKFETYGISKTWWVFPSLTISTDTRGWSTNLLPIFYFGRDGESSHSVIAPVFWDFASPKSRATVAFPLYWRFSETADNSVTQIAGNTLYMQKKVAGGIDWQFHFLPVFSYGDNPTGHWWNVLFGLVGYDRSGDTAKVKAFWLPIEVAGPKGGRAAGTELHRAD